MKKNSFTLATKLVVGVIVVAPFIVFAKLGDATTTRQQIINDHKETFKENQQDREKFRKESIEKIKLIQSEIQAGREALKNKTKGLTRDEAKKQLKEFRKESQDKREGIHTEIKDAREEFRKKADERRDELKKKIGEERSKQVEKYFTQMMDRMDAAADRLDKLADRIESRLNKIHDAGKDIIEPQAALDTARIAIAGVHAAISDAKAKFAELATSDTPQAQFAAVKDIVNTVKTKSKEAHAALVEAINSIKKLRLDIEATSTPQTQ